MPAQPGRSAALLFLLLFSLAPVSLLAQPEQITFRHLTIADGLSQNAVYAIVQDHRGFMWFGTKDGLNRFDGYTFTVFRHDPFDSTSVADNYITALFEDSRGRLWVGTQGGGLNRFDRAHETFHRYPNGPTHQVTSIDEDLDGNMWIGTVGDGLYRLLRKEIGQPDAAFERFAHDPNAPRSLASNHINAVLVDGRGTLWVTAEAQLHRLDLTAWDAETAGFTRYALNLEIPAGMEDAGISALCEDRKGQLWVGSASGLSLFDRATEQFSHYYHRYRSYRYGWGRVIQLLEDRAGTIWLSTHTELMRFDPTTRTFTSFRHDPLQPQGINSNLPTALYQDRSDVLWIGTNGYGLNVYDPKADRFHTFRRPEDRPSRISGFSVYTLFEDAAGRIWINGGVLYQWDRKTDRFISFETSSDRPDDFGNTGVWSILEDPEGFLWTGTYQGLYHYEIATGRYRHWKHDPNDPGGLPEQEVRDVFKDRDGALWIVTENYLARMVDQEMGRFRSYLYEEQQTRNEWTFPSAVQDRDGFFWLGSNQGLVRFDPTTETFRHFRNDPGQPTSLSHNVVRALLLDPHTPDKYLWIGTAGGGLNRFDLRNETFDHYSEDDGLPNNVVYGVQADEAGTLWLSTNKGLSRFDPATGEFRNYDANDGLQSNEFNSGASFKSRSGELFFGGIYGFNYFYPDDIKDNPHVPPVVITGFKRLNRYESVRDSSTVLTRALSETDALRLSYRDNVITFEFSALDYSAPSKNRYAYTMEGFNDDWINAGAIRSATYTNLPPGTYTFRVKGANNDGVWNEEGVSLAVTIVPPPWKTWWAFTGYGLLVVALLYGLRRYEMNRLRLKSRLEMEHVEAMQLRELDRVKSHFFANVSHEFRTPLTLTLGPLDDLRAGLYGTLTPAMAEQVDLARRNAARVLDLINQILDVARLEAGRTPLHAHRLDLGAFVQDLAGSFVPLAERKALAFGVHAPTEPLFVYADPEHLEKILTNLLSNALKFTAEGGAVRVTVTAGAETARVAIRDSGPGIPADELPHVFERFHRINESSTRIQPGTGIGLALAKELVDLHGGSLTVESEEGFGSTFTVALRRGRAHLTPDQVVVEAIHPRKPRVTTCLPLPVSEGDGMVTDAAEDDMTTVLVVEDNTEVRAYIRRHLQPTYRVVEAVDGADGLAKARDLLPDLILSDVMMPVLDGYALCRTLKAAPETDFIPVILLTAKAAPEDRLEGLREHADDYLTKPFDVAELHARIENLIASRQRLRTRFGSEATPALHPNPVDATAADAVFLEQVRKGIETHLGDDAFSVEQLAEEVGLSRSQLHRRLRDLLDQSPSEIIRLMRLERAAHLLEARAGTVSEVAYAVGFKSVSHFSNSFARHFGCRPSAYQAAE